MVELATVFATQAKDGRRHDQRQERPELLRRRLPQAGVLGRLLGHPRLPQPGAAGLAADLARTTRRTGRRSRATGSNFGGLYNQALAATDDAKRIEIEHQMQQYEYDLGGYIIPFFGNLIDGYSVEGAGPRRRARAR